MDKQETDIALAKDNKFNKIIEKADWFFHSDYYIALLAALTFIGWVTNLWVPFLFVTLSLTIIMFAVCKDTTPLFAFMWFFLYTISTSQYELGNYGWMLFLVIPLVGAIIFNLIRTKPPIKEILSPKKIKSSTLSMILLIIPISLGGLAYPVSSVGARLIVVALFVVLAFAFIYYMALSKKYIKDKDTLIKYIIKLMFAMGLILFAEMFVASIRTGSYEAFKIMVNNESISLGWSNPNIIAAGVALCLPSNFYYMLKKKKFAFMFMIIALLEYLSIIITGSRGTLLVATIALPLILVYVFIKTENKMQIYITAGIIFAAILATGIIFIDEVKALLNVFIEGGLSSSGRETHYKMGWDLFTDYPIFGAGWDYGIGDGRTGFSPYLFHSTAVHVLACSGLIGVIAFLYFYWARYSTFFKKRTAETLTLLAGMVIFEAYGMVDPVLFFPPTYFIILLTMSFAVEQAMPEESCRPLIFKNKLFFKN